MTMFSDSMITWFMPTRRLSFADGTSTRQVIWRCEQPIIWPRSLTSGGTRRSASIVTRVIGGIA